MFERSLTALIKGLRSHRGRDEARYIALMLDEIRTEVKSGDMDVKAQAVLKLAYLQMLGYQASSVSFHILETMASPAFDAKYIGYLAASLCFTQDTEVLILATNMIKKDLYSAVPHDVAAALNGLSHIITQELAQHLARDIIAMLSHSRPGIRKRAVIVLYSAILKYPEILDHAMPRLRDRLDDPDQSVVTATVNVVCELARRNPKPFVLLSPQLFHILTTETKNWLLIKIIKLFGTLAQVEPRLVRRLAPRISELLASTPAMSLIYECIHTLIVGGMFGGTSGEELAVRCVDNLSRFLTDSDQNLKYIALLALVKMLPTHAHLVAMHQETILRSLYHPDLTIRLRSLDLACGLASRTNLYRIVTALVAYLSADKTDASSALSAALGGTGAATESADFRLHVAESILDLGSARDYGNIPDSAWYFDVLVRLATTDGVEQRAADQIAVLAGRDEQVQSLAISRLLPLIDDLFGSPELLRAGAWVWGAYPSEVDDVPGTVRALLRPELGTLGPDVIVTIMTAAIKMYAYWTATLTECWDAEARTMLEALSAHLTHTFRALSEHEHPEIHQRAMEGLHLFEFIDAELAHRGEGPPRSLHLLEPLFFTQEIEEPNEHPLPMSFDMHAWVVPQSTWAQVHKLVEPKVRKTHAPKAVPREPVAHEPRQQRAVHTDDPFYLKPRRKARAPKAPAPAPEPAAAAQGDDDLAEVPIVNIGLEDLSAPPEASVPGNVQPKVVTRKKRTPK